MNKWVKTVPKTNLYREYLKALNGILNLTSRQIELLALILELDANTQTTADKSKNVISAENRKFFHEKLNMGYDYICKYIKKFKQMGILVNGSIEDEVFVNKSLIPDIIGDRVQMNIILRIDKLK